MCTPIKGDGGLVGRRFIPPRLIALSTCHSSEHRSDDGEASGRRARAINGGWVNPIPTNGRFVSVRHMQYDATSPMSALADFMRLRGFVQREHLLNEDFDLSLINQTGELL
jgi:hypothetical protein